MPAPDRTPDVGADAELPEWLAELRDRIGPITGKDLSRFLPPKRPKPREGAVLVLFGEGPEGPDLLLTERAHSLRSQPGQVAFPGGSLDPGEDAVAAALREAEEEIGIDASGIAVFAVLPRLWLPPRNFAVAPVLGFWRHDDHLQVTNPDEVHSVFRAPIAELLDPSRRFLVRHPLGWSGPGWMVGHDRDVLLWGFTAGVINAIFDYVGWTREWDRSVTRRLPDHLLTPPEPDHAEGP